jgi:hypothetical protein
VRAMRRVADLARLVRSIIGCYVTMRRDRTVVGHPSVTPAGRSVVELRQRSAASHRAVRLWSSNRIRFTLNRLGGQVMTTTTGLLRPAVPAEVSELIDVDPFSVPCLGLGAPPLRRSPTAMPGMSSAAKIVKVQRVEPPPIVGPLAWGTTEERTIVFRVDATAGRELQVALDAGEEPTAIVEPEQIVGMDIDVLR